MVSKTLGRIPITSLSICPKPRSLLEHRLLSGTCSATCLWQSIRGLVSRRPCSSVRLPVLVTDLCSMEKPCEQVTWNADTSRFLFAGGGAEHRCCQIPTCQRQSSKSWSCRAFIAFFNAMRRASTVAQARTDEFATRTQYCDAEASL